jgi:transcriptional regulator with XRE-family HTH domain
MKERLLEFLRTENKTSAQLAEEIGVQASGISHILSGRNNPSLDFVLKMLEKYQFLSTEWLLFGRGSMYKDAKVQSLFDFSPSENAINETKTKNENIPGDLDFNKIVSPRPGRSSADSGSGSVPGSASDAVKIVWFYDDNSFEEFIPRK